mmetsp:Transcript_40021/g.110202  ORF Transcript_40021/g.110202 Transcript_40021/m.110202 type:complete len:657 (+) Transcript_40021:72-2042(+)|eukprot:CAMPEP_0117616722 /NCGR_PEP_ID=MMETSP0784-20121206/85210_1 /TAXON_ID=39447 /ORGANISM="" /LENGTH=656 /DNA_ID=CAMNT_0005420515 /DNA_START=75 /DNA_END=2045 /DNA_ORIENTATION=+
MDVARSGLQEWRCSSLEDLRRNLQKEFQQLPETLACHMRAVVHDELIKVLASSIPLASSVPDSREVVDDDSCATDASGSHGVALSRFENGRDEGATSREQPSQETVHMNNSFMAMPAFAPVLEKAEVVAPDAGRDLESVCSSDDWTVAHKDASRTPCVPRRPATPMQAIVPLPGELPSSSPFCGMQNYTSTSILQMHAMLSQTSSETPRSHSSVSSVSVSNPSYWAPLVLVRRCVESTRFESLISMCIVVNAIVIGMQVDYRLNHVGENPPRAFEVVEVIFCAVFTAELICRVIAYHVHFFIMPGWGWNLFDFVMVIMQLLDAILAHYLVVDGDENSTSGNFSFMRLLRILRIVRIVRVVRVFRYVSELRAMVSSILSSCKPLVWVMALVLLFSFAISVYLASLVADRGESLENVAVKKYYRSLMITLFSLFQAVTGGIDWGDLATPLMAEISPLVAIVFTLYMSFAVLCILNVITSIFVQTALNRAEEDNETRHFDLLRSVVRAADIDRNGKISREDFSKAIRNEGLAEKLDLRLCDASAMFDLLDVDNSGQVDLDEFVFVCIRIKGANRGIDMASLMYFNKRIAVWWADRIDAMEKDLGNILNLLGSSPPTARGSSVSRHNAPPASAAPAGASPAANSNAVPLTCARSLLLGRT